MRKLLCRGVLLFLVVAITMPIIYGLKADFAIMASGYVAIDATNFPDDNFRLYLSNYKDQDSNGILSDQEISNVTTIDISGSMMNGVNNPYCYDVSGIEIFTNLKYLYCSMNNITTLDISYFPDLEELECYRNNLSSLDLSNNPCLKKLICYDNNLTSLDVSNNPNLELLTCSNNNITSLDASNCPAISTLSCFNNSLTSLNISNCSALKTLLCYDNALSSLDATNCSNLNTLECFRNNLSSLYLLNKTCLKHLDCSNNNLTSLDVSNSPELYFLSCYSNQLTSLDASNNTNLRYLYCYDNNLTSLDVTNCSNLDTLECYCNNLSSLCLLNTTSLEFIDCGINNLEMLDVSNCPALYQLFCGDNNLTSLDLSNNTSLVYLYCDDNNLTSLDVSNCPSLYCLVCNNNNLSYLDVTNNGDLFELSWDNNFDSLSLDDIEAFVGRLYTIALGRSSVEKQGMWNWTNQIASKTETGGAVAKFFLTCPEMVNRNLSNEDYVEILYRLFFDRASDRVGKDYWLGQLNGGTSRESIIDGFINSIEWANICASYGIESGGTAQPNFEPTENINAFVERIYTKCLGRGSDPTGLDRWGREIVNRRMTATEVAYGFFFSDEFIGFGLSDEEYIERLYLTFIDRPSDEAGRNDWLNRLRNGASRQDVFFGIANSSEFNGICESYGIYN